MSDLFSPLRTPQSEPLPTSPAEVRRLGDRARQRRTALVAGGAALAVAAIASGVVLLGPEPAQQIQPAPPVETTAEPDTIPADFPLDVGMIEEPDTASDEPWLGDIEYCGGASASMADTAVDSRFAQTLIPGDNQLRSLELFATAAEAKARALDHVGKFRACPEYTTAVGSVALTEVTDNGIGDQGWTVARTFTTEGEPQFGQEVFQVVRSGRALLITERTNEGPGSTDVDGFQAFVTQDLESTADVVRAMCPWSEEGCVGG